MFKGSIKALLVTILAVSLVLPFTIYSFADPYLGTEFIVNSDGTVTLKNNNPSGQTFSSGSEIQYNVWNNNPVIDDNTFNGSTSITNTFNNLTSADNNFTGNTTLQVVDGGGNIESNLDTFNTMTVAAAGTNLNFNDSTFQGAVNINDAGVVQIGSTTESAQIVTNTGNTVTQLQTTNSRLSTINTTISNFRTAFDSFVTGIISPIAILYDNIVYPVYSDSSGTRTFSVGGNSYSYNLKNLYFGGANHYFNFSGLLFYWFNTLCANLSVQFSQNATSESDGFIVSTLNTYPLRYYKFTYYTYSYTSSTDVINIQTNYKYFSFVSYLANILTNQLGSYISANIAYMADTWYRWYSPNISASDSQFWIAFNTDTEVYDHVNLSTVFGYITWYLGQLYIQGNEAAADISQSVDDMATAFTDLESKENQINNNIKNSLNSVDSFFNLPAIASGSVVIGWLQYMWVSLGMFQGVTIIAWALIILTIVTGFYKVKRITV